MKPRLLNPINVLLCSRHREFGAFANAFWPTLHDAFLPGIKAHAFFAIRMHITEERTLPAAEAMPSHGDRNRHINAHHADLDAAAKLTGDIAVAREATHAIAELVRVDERYGLREIVDSNAPEHGAEDFFLVNAHVRRDVIEQRAARPETLLAALAGCAAIKAASIDQQLGAFFHSQPDVSVDAF